MVGMLLPLTATAADLKADLTIYYDVSTFGDFSGKKLQVMIGHGSYSTTYEMKAVEGYDNLYSVNIGEVNSGNAWGGATQLGFMAADAIWGGESNGSSSQPKERIKWAPMYSGIYNISSTLSGNVLFTGKDALSITKDYKLPAKAPVITIGAAPEFATTTVGQTATATVTYTVENSEEKPEISLDNDAFKAEDAGGTITITFAPTEAKEYTATLTLAIGEVEASVDLAATAKAEDAPVVPEILNLAAGEIAEIFAGETTEFVVTYELLNAEEATVSIEGEGFTIKKQDKGTATIEFAPTEAKTYEAVVTVTSGETIKTLEISATAKKAPVIVTIGFVNPDWTEAAIWAWIEGGANLTGGTWPGKLMTKGENGKFTYELEIPEDGNYKFIINNNNKGVQSNDLPGVTESTCYVIETLVDGKFSVAVSESCEYQAPVEPEPIEPYVAIRGTMTNWDVANDIKMTYNADAANGPEWYITAFEVPADGKFKVVSVDAQSQATWYGSDKVDLQEGITNAGQGDGDIALPAGKYDIYFKVNEGRMWIQKYVEPTPEPDPLPVVITFVDEVTFPKTFVGETTNDIIEFTLENAAEDAEVKVEVTGEAFSVAEVQDNFIFLAFAPEAEGEYAGVLTVTVGEVSESLEFTAVASPVEPEPEPAELEFALVGRLNGDNDNEILAFEDGYKFTQESEFVYTLNITFTGAIEASGKQVQKVKLVDAEGNIWARNSSKTIKPGDGTSTMTKGETASSTYLQCEAGVEYKITYTLVSDEANSLYKLSGQITFEEVQAEEPEPTPDPEPEPDPTPEYPKTITVKVACAWDACNIWAWYADGSGNVYTEWPGEPMTKGEDGFYAIDMTIESPVYFKVNAGLGKTESDNYMTELSESTCFNMDGLALVVNEDCEYEEPIEIEPYYGIRGLVSWEMADDIKLTEDTDKAEWYITNVEVDGTQEFKVVYVDKTGAATWFGSEAVELQEGVVNNGTDNIILAAGKYDIYFKANDGMMWIQFSSETPTDVEDAAAELIYAIDGTIIAPAPFAIIDLSGKDVTNANGSLQGTYIVKTQNSTAKISVK